MSPFVVIKFKKLMITVNSVQVQTLEFRRYSPAFVRVMCQLQIICLTYTPCKIHRPKNGSSNS